MTALEVIVSDEHGTVRDYLHNLLLTLWREEESFSGKRPFGDSGWQHDVYVPLIKHGFIPGTLDEYDCIEEYDHDMAMAFVMDLISECFETL